MLLLSQAQFRLKFFEATKLLIDKGQRDPREPGIWEYLCVMDDFDWIFISIGITMAK